MTDAPDDDPDSVDNADDVDDPNDPDDPHDPNDPHDPPDRPERVDGSPTDFGSTYRLLSGAIVPRPIAWVATRSEDGVDNLAPFSFSNVASVDPPVLLFSPGGDDDDLKDTPRNALETGGFVVHVVTEDVAEAMNATSATLPPDESEFEHAGLTPVPAEHVDAARIAEARVAFECELYDTLRVGRSLLVLGEVVHAHVDPDLLTEGKFDVRELDAVGRLAGSWYSTTRDRFAMSRPP